MDTQTNSVDGNRYDQVFSNGTFFDEIYTMDRKSYTWIALKNSSQVLEHMNRSPLKVTSNRVHLVHIS